MQSKNDISIPIEAATHAALEALARELSENHGVKLENASFLWCEREGLPPALVEVRLITSARARQ